MGLIFYTFIYYKSTHYATIRPLKANCFHALSDNMKRHILSSLFVFVLYTLCVYGYGTEDDFIRNLNSPIRVWKSTMEVTLAYYVIGLYVAENLYVNERYKKLLYSIPLLTSCLAPLYILVHTNGMSPLFEVGWIKMICPAPVVMLSLLIFYVPWKRRGSQGKSGYRMSPRMASAAVVFIAYKILGLAVNICRATLCKGEQCVDSPYLGMVDSPYLVINGATDVFLYYVIWLYVAECIKRRFNTGRWVYLLPLLIVCLVQALPAFVAVAAFSSSVPEGFVMALHALTMPMMYLHESFCLLPAIILGLYYYRIHESRRRNNPIDQQEFAAENDNSITWRMR